MSSRSAAAAAPPVRSLSGREVRRLILDQSRRANVGHIGSALSVADVLATLFDGVIEGEPGDRDRDRFVMCKGHAALALYATLHLAGRLSAAELDTYMADGSLLAVHPNHNLPSVDFSTGSLGQGLSIAAGAALAARLEGSRRRVFALLSDAECNEGSVWEAVMFMAHHRLDNVVAVVDDNGQQALGYTRDVLALEPMADRWASFGWEVRTVDGHDPSALREAVERPSPGRPRAVIARTTFGKGVPFMESQIRWHYLPMNEDQHAVALAGLGADHP